MLILEVPTAAMRQQLGVDILQEEQESEEEADFKTRKKVRLFLAELLKKEAYVILIDNFIKISK